MPIDVDSLQVHKPRELDPDASAPIGLRTGPDGQVWVLHESEVGVFRGKEEVIVYQGLPAPPTHLEFSGGGVLLVGHAQGVEAIQGGSSMGNLPLAEGTLDLLWVRPDGKVVVGWTVPTAEGPVGRAGLWSLTGLSIGQAPEARFDGDAALERYIGAAGMRDGALFCFLRSEAQDGEEGAVFLGASLAQIPAFVSNVDERGLIAATPDGRYLLRTRAERPDDVLRLERVVAGEEMVEAFSMPLDGPPRGAAFTPSGERLFVPVGNVDEVVVFQ